MNIKEKLSQLDDASSPAFGVVSSVAVGVLTLVDPAKLQGAGRTAVRSATAVLTGWSVAASVDHGRPVLVPLRAVAGLAAAGAAFALADKSDRLDARMVQALRSAGLQHPRRWLAAGTTAIMFGSYLLDRALKSEPEYVAIEDLERVRPLAPEVRHLVEGILRAADVPGAAALLSQLDDAQELYWDEEFSSTAQFRVPDEVPRAVPHNQVFPVGGRFTDPNGRPLQLLLQVFDGKIDHLAIDAVDPDDTDDLDDLINRWPDPSEVTFVLDGPDGNTTPIAR
jgi:hypothetical protein